MLQSPQRAICWRPPLYTALTGQAPFVRGDWFWDTASRAPLYDTLINLPATLNQLAQQVGVNIANDINHPGQAEPENLVRFAVLRSGVSLHNRMAERHLGNAGQYLWISYDFKTDTGREDIFFAHHDERWKIDIFEVGNRIRPFAHSAQHEADVLG